MIYKYTKSFISILLILLLLLSINIVSFAQDPFSGFAIGGIGGASAGGLFGTMAGMSGVDISSPNDPVSDSMWNKLNPESVYFSGEKHEATGQGEDLYDYITVDIGDWLDAQSDFIAQFISENNVDDNDSGNFTNQYFDGLSFTTPVPWSHQHNELYPGTLSWINFPTEVEAEANTTFGYARLRLRCYRVKNNYTDCTREVYYRDTLVSSGNITGYIPNNPKMGLTYYYANGGYNLATWDGNSANPSGVNYAVTNLGQLTTYGYLWESNTVQPGVYDNWEGAKLKILHSQSGLTSPWTIEDFMEMINDLWENDETEKLIIEDTATPVPPVPPSPLPTTPLGEVPYDEWVDTWGQHVITNQETGNDSLDNIDTNIQTGVDTLDSIDTNIGTTNGILGQIKDLIQSGINSITSLLNQILSGVQALVNSIVNATETLIAGILNQIPIAFQSAWNTLKQHVSIWHYVVEWVTSITAPLTWIWGIASGASYYIILPVYASLAGAVVLALYKKFGR